MSSESRNPWAEYPPKRIPTKTELPELERFLEEAGPGGRLLDLGCGDGRLSHVLAARGYDVVGVDINEGAVEAARSVPGGPGTNRPEFWMRDIASERGLKLPGPPFRLVVCQLVISVVGGPRERRALLENAQAALEPGGCLYLSASGVSGDINPSYRDLYESDFPETGERHTYFSRDNEGNILYTTHHFEEDELRALVESAGFEITRLQRKAEASSRRPEQAAYFFYLVAWRRQLSRDPG